MVYRLISKFAIYKALFTLIAVLIVKRVTVLTIKGVVLLVSII